MSDLGKRNMSGIVALLLILVIGLALTPTIQELVIAPTSGTYNASDGTGAGNLSGASRAIYLLVPLFWVILVIGVVLGGVILWLRT